MNKTTSLSHSHRRRGFSMTEVLMAIAIVSIFVSGMIAVFVQVTRTADQSQAVTKAVSNARAALDMMALDIKQANYGGSFPGRFVAFDNPTPLVTAGGARYGDGQDNDQDGKIDEETSNALDDDADWTTESDRHALISPGRFERATFRGVADLGDAKVDEDCQFESDILGLRIYPKPGDTAARDIEMIYSLGSFEGRDHVLLKTVRDPASAQNTVKEVAPLAENVLSFSATYWNPNSDKPYWVTSWDSQGSMATAEPGLPLPSSVYLQLQVYADSRPIDQYHPGDPVKVETVSTIVNIEQIIHDPRYRRP